MDPANATVEGNFPGEGDNTVYFLLCASIPVLALYQRPSLIAVAVGEQLT